MWNNLNLINRTSNRQLQPWKSSIKVDTIAKM